MILRRIAFAAAALAAAVLPVLAGAQELPVDQKHRHDCARAKAEHFARVQSAITAQTPNQEDYDVFVW